MNQIGKYMIFAGAVLIALGILFYFFGEKLGRIGNLPGDIKIEKENVKIYFPITTMILLSLLLSFILWLYRKYF
jgi:hypothetical protein